MARRTISTRRRKTGPKGSVRQFNAWISRLDVLDTFAQEFDAPRGVILDVILDAAMQSQKVRRRLAELVPEMLEPIL